MKNRTPHSKDELKLKSAIEKIEAVRDKVVQKLGSGMTQAQGHIGVLTNLDNDLKVLNRYLDDLNPKNEVETPTLQNAADGLTQDSDVNVGSGPVIERPQPPTEEVSKPRGGRPKGSTNKPKV